MKFVKFLPILLILLSAVGYSQCPEPQIILRNDTAWQKEDEKRVEMAKDGCKRRYGENACLTKFVKNARLSYYGICKR